MTYRAPLADRAELDTWVAEGPVGIEQEDGALALFSTADEAELGDHAHWTLWCPEEFGADIRVAWDFRPLTDEGLAMVFVGASGADGRQLFDPGLAPRTGHYPQYHSGDIRALHISYYRRKWATERRFHTCNLRKSPGFHLVAQGADPLPAIGDVDGFYRIAVERRGASIAFSIDDLRLFEWTDVDDAATGPPVGAGRIGFRQMAPLRALYRNLEVTAL